jgi:hypothetical protein
VIGVGPQTGSLTLQSDSSSTPTTAIYLLRQILEVWFPEMVGHRLLDSVKALLFTIGLVALHACVNPEEDLALIEHEQEMRREEITVRDCRPGFLPFGEGENLTCIPDPSWSEGGGGGPGPDHTMDPEPDHYKDRKSCYDWCDWSIGSARSGAGKNTRSHSVTGTSATAV